MALRVGVPVATLAPEWAIPALGRQKAEGNPITRAMRIHARADQAVGAGAFCSLWVDRKIGNREAVRITAAAARHPGDQLGLAGAVDIHARTHLAPARSLIHNQLRWQGRVRLLE